MIVLSFIVFFLICTGYRKRAGMTLKHAAVFSCYDLRHHFSLQGFLRLFCPLPYKYITTTQKAIYGAFKGVIKAYYNRAPYTASHDASGSRSDGSFILSNFN